VMKQKNLILEDDAVNREIWRKASVEQCDQFNAAKLLQIRVGGYLKVNFYVRLGNSTLSSGYKVSGRSGFRFRVRF
jgi:hypothetical protein